MSYEMIKPIIIEALRAYADYGRPVGDFLTACLENDLMEALGRADDDNRKVIFEICMYIHWEIPAICHGSKEAVRKWLKRDWTEARKMIAD